MEGGLWKEGYGRKGMEGRLWKTGSRGGRCDAAGDRQNGLPGFGVGPEVIHGPFYVSGRLRGTKVIFREAGMVGGPSAVTVATDWMPVVGPRRHVHFVFVR